MPALPAPSSRAFNDVVNPAHKTSILELSRTRCFSAIDEAGLGELSASPLPRLCPHRNRASPYGSVGAGPGGGRRPRSAPSDGRRRRTGALFRRRPREGRSIAALALRDLRNGPARIPGATGRRTGYQAHPFRRAPPAGARWRPAPAPCPPAVRRRLGGILHQGPLRRRRGASTDAIYGALGGDIGVLPTRMRRSSSNVRRRRRRERAPSSISISPTPRSRRTSRTTPAASLPGPVAIQTAAGFADATRSLAGDHRGRRAVGVPAIALAELRPIR